jgi:two-component system, NarL family, invasion response regulator UvrY
VRGDEDEGGAAPPPWPPASQGPPTVPDVPIPTADDAPEPTSSSPSSVAGAVRVAIIVSNDVGRLGFEQIVLQAPGFEVAAVGNHPSVVADGSPVDVAIVGFGEDVSMGDLRAILAVCPRVMCFARPPYRASAVDAGVSSFMSGASDRALIIEVMTLVAAGGTYLPESAFPPDLLSPREREVLRCVATGCTDREIGEQLGISIRTAQSHLDRIREKTGRRRRAELTALAFELGLARVT